VASRSEPSLPPLFWHCVQPEVYHCPIPRSTLYEGQHIAGMSGTPVLNRNSRQGFERVPTNMNGYQHDGDATIDIPLENVRTNTGRSRDDSIAPLQSRPTVKSTHRRTFGHRIKPTASKSQAKKVGYDGEENTLNAMGRFYRRVLSFSIITRYFVYVLPLGLCIAVPIIVGASVAQNAMIGGVRIVWFFSWVEIGMLCLHMIPEHR